QGLLMLLGDSTPTSCSGGPARMRRAPRDHPIETPVRSTNPKIGTTTATESSTGKTRSCHEALRKLAQHDWKVWHPDGPDDLLTGWTHLGKKTVVWLDEADRYLGAIDGLGEQVAGALGRLLARRETRPIVVLGTMWPEPCADLMTKASVAKLLRGRRIRVSEQFSAQETAELQKLAKHDTWLADASEQAREGRYAQFLTGAPHLADRFAHAPAVPRALVETAIDLHRLGRRNPTPQTFLRNAVADYLGADAWDALDDNHLQRAWEYLAQPLRGGSALLRTARPRPIEKPDPDGPILRLADYIAYRGQQDRQHLCPPSSFWEASVHFLHDPQTQWHLGHSAQNRMRHRHAVLLYAQAAEGGHPRAMRSLTKWLKAFGADQVAAHWKEKAEQVEAIWGWTGTLDGVESEPHSFICWMILTQ
ncbi:hypothetical protein ACWCQN_46625, partial [Streptomyces sp. NPDC001984]